LTKVTIAPVLLGGVALYSAPFIVTIGGRFLRGLESPFRKTIYEHSPKGV
jgi:hypothetical protein